MQYIVLPSFRRAAGMRHRISSHEHPILLAQELRLLSTACRSAEETVSALTLQLAQAEANASAAVLKQQQAQASGGGCGISEPQL